MQVGTHTCFDTRAGFAPRTRCAGNSGFSLRATRDALGAAGPARRSDLGCAGGKRRPVTSPHTASCLAAVAASAVIAGCGGGTRTVTRHGTSSAPAAPTPASPPAPPPAPTPAVAAGPATVCTQRSRVGPTYDTAVAFMMSNQSDSAVVDVPYRVTVTGRDKTHAVTKGDDTINPYV